MTEPPPTLPDFIDVSKRYENNPRIEMVKDAWLYFGKKLSERQYELGKEGKNKRVHEGLLVAMVDPVSNTIRHADQMNESKLGEDPLLTPQRGHEEDKESYQERLDEYFFVKVAELGVLGEEHDGAIVVARDGTLLGTGVYLQARNCDKEKLHKGYATRHRAALASSYLNEYIWCMALSEEDNIIRVYEKGEAKKVYDPADKDKHSKTAV